MALRPVLTNGLPFRSVFRQIRRKEFALCSKPMSQVIGSQSLIPKFEDPITHQTDEQAASVHTYARVPLALASVFLGLGGC